MGARIWNVGGKIRKTTVNRWKLQQEFLVKPTRCTNVSNIFYFGLKLYMFRTVFRSIISSSRLYIQLSNRYCWLLANNQSAVSVWHTPVAVCTVLNCWWWTERPSETCRVSIQNKINLIHWCIWLVLLQKYITMHGPVNVKSATGNYRDRRTAGKGSTLYSDGYTV